MWFKHSMSIAQQLTLFYKAPKHKNKTNVALKVVNCLCYKLNDTNRPLGRSASGENPLNTQSVNIDLKRKYLFIIQKQCKSNH